MTVQGVSTDAPDPSDPVPIMTSVQTKPMKVYAVIAGADYEGENFDTLRLFDCLSAAEAYKAELYDDRLGVDYVRIETREVIMQSAIAANINTKGGIATPW